VASTDAPIKNGDSPVKNLEVLLIVVPLQCREEQRLCRSAFASAKLERDGEIGKKWAGTNSTVPVQEDASGADRQA
jgi:hypothetical protein